jgi:hypothetical protein
MQIFSYVPFFQIIQYNSYNQDIYLYLNCKQNFYWFLDNGRIEDNRSNGLNLNKLNV